MTELKGWRKYVLEIVKLTAALLLYSHWSPAWQPLVPNHPYIGGGLAGIASATAVILLTYVIWPFARVRVTVQRENDTPYDGPSADLVAPSNDAYAALYTLRIRAQSFGLLGHLILRNAAKRGLQVTFQITTSQLVLHAENGLADEESLETGVVIPLPSRPSTISWAYIRLSAASREMPSHLPVEVVTRLLYPNGTEWWEFGLWSSSNLKRIVLSRKEN